MEIIHGVYGKYQIGVELNFTTNIQRKNIQSVPFEKKNKFYNLQNSLIYH